MVSGPVGQPSALDSGWVQQADLCFQGDDVLALFPRGD
ncbi:hypothetical protein [Enterobacter phage vB_ExiM_F5M1E]|nr:hypothetical protein [Enterobacter phage vB_ExiM_F1M1E]UNA03167.1 hypothetical protein [Enterobacter phage vB_ExiM_F2M1E]UNA03488.1 hypothetical protein [Enterobacter phage vB_ExiM_F4M1E]UNA03809.1 hypothetical protein [Enterobacter phage vB_ExiM_F5M1E]UNA04129.1 hypothetical protein [Pantoea phage vB_PdiM_F5M2A]